MRNGFVILSRFPLENYLTRIWPPSRFVTVAKAVTVECYPRSRPFIFRPVALLKPGEIAWHRCPAKCDPLDSRSTNPTKPLKRPFFVILCINQGLDEGFRVVVNDGVQGCQTVYHLHIHVIVSAVRGTRMTARMFSIPKNRRKVDT